MNAQLVSSTDSIKGAMLSELRRYEKLNMVTMKPKKKRIIKKFRLWD